MLMSSMRMAGCLRLFSLAVRMARIDQGSQWLVCESQLPDSRGQIRYVPGRMLTHALQHIHQIGVRVQVVQFARGDQTLDDPNMLSPQFGPAEQPAPSSHWNGPQGSFQVVRIWLHVRVFQEYGQA